MNPHKRVGKAGFITRWIGDTAYKCGQCFYKSMPGPISDKVQSAAPDSIKNVDGAIERTCCLFVFLQVSLVFVFLWSLWNSYYSCRKQEFLSLDEGTSPYCESQKIAISDKFYLDDSGNWDTSRYWAFADTMVAGEFKQYEHSKNDWFGDGNKRLDYGNGISEEFYKVLFNWNKEMENQGQAANFVKVRDVQIEDRRRLCSSC